MEGMKSVVLKCTADNLSDFFFTWYNMQVLSYTQTLNYVHVSNMSYSGTHPHTTGYPRSRGHANKHHVKEIVLIWYLGRWGGEGGGG